MMEIFFLSFARPPTWIFSTSSSLMHWLSSSSTALFFSFHITLAALGVGAYHLQPCLNECTRFLLVFTDRGKEWEEGKEPLFVGLDLLLLRRRRHARPNSRRRLLRFGLTPLFLAVEPQEFISSFIIWR